MYATWLRMLLINLIDVAVVTRGKSWIGQVTPYCGMRFFFLDCVSFHRITLAPVPSLLIPALIGRRMTGH